jgi:peptidyl-Lys metalloendopeptidase
VDLLVNVTGPSSVTADKFKVTTILSNNGDKDVTLLNDPNSILMPQYKTDVFGIVSKHGTPARFGGICVKWSPELAIANKDFTVIKAGESLEIKQDLSGVYDFSEGDTKSWSIGSASVFQLVHHSGVVTDYLASVDPHHIKLAGSPTPKSFAPKPRPMGLSFYGCSAQQQADIELGVAQANTYIEEVNTYIAGLDGTSDRYNTWFGEWTQYHQNVVKGHFLALSGDPSDSTYDCSSCTKGDSVFAYVQPDEPGYVYLCNAFWRAPVAGTDSKGGTIVHEQSHFLVNGGTQDYVYGQAKAQRLAKANPSRAVMNADSTEYFAENTPDLD